MEELIQNLKNEALAQILSADNFSQLQELRVNFLGRTSRLNQLLKEIPNLPPEKRKRVGQIINDAKGAIEAAISQKQGQLLALKKPLEKEWIDVTAPAKKVSLGRAHIITRAIEEIETIFARLGYKREETPEIELDWYAFTALNMPKDHPARDEWETFYISPKLVLTPHTTSADVRLMKKYQGKPFRSITIGKCYRRQSDLTHNPVFYQFDLVAVDRGITLSDLKGTLEYFVQSFFGKERKIRLRPHHFRFTEPSFEVDVTCSVCQGTGRVRNALCRVCKNGWLELAGAGLLHPEVLKNAGFNPKVWQGLAAGWGIERTYLMKEGVNVQDIRILYQPDIRFLQNI